MITLSPIRDAIVAADQQWELAFGRGDVAAVAQMYTENAQVLPPQSEPIAGRQAIQSFWQEAMDSGLKAARFEIMEVRDLGDAAYEVGQYTVMGAAGQVLDQGKYIEIWQRESDQWKIKWDLWNSSLPAS